MYLPATELEFYEDAYKASTEAWVDDHGHTDDGRSYLRLSNTICYPQGGGQKGDRGTFLVPGTDERVAIVDTRKTLGPSGSIEVRHILQRALDDDEVDQVVGERAEIELDWAFRYRQMRLHSAAHLLHIFLEQRLGRALEQPQMSDLQDGHGVNRYDRLVLDQSVVSEAVALLNRFIPSAAAIRTAPQASGPDGARVWVCEQWSIPCGGVHPARTSEVSPVSAVVSVKKGRSSISFRMIEPLSVS